MNARPVATIDQETEHLLGLYKGDAGKIMGELQSQLAILANRAQTLLSLAGITITVTGFSGANIARSGRVPAALLVCGLFFVLSSATIAMHGILRVRWATALPPCELPEAVRATLELREVKTRKFDLSLRLLVAGLTLYVSSIALLLLRNLPQ